MSDTTTYDADTVARRIRGLLSKTVENGCSEAEAMAAAALARKLMDQYRLTQTDVEIEAEPIAQEWIERPNAEKLAAVDHCLTGINRYCGVKSWFSWQGGKRKVRVIGLRTDTEMAGYLYRMIAAAIAIELKRFNAERDAAGWRYSLDKRRDNAAFQVAMAYRVNSRLCEMACALEPVAKTSSGTALVVVKTAVVEAAFAKLNIRFGGRGLSGMSGSNGSASASSAGHAAGDRVNLSRPVGGATTHRLA